jgi:hypothetical protein
MVGVILGMAVTVTVAVQVRDHYATDYADALVAVPWTRFDESPDGRALSFAGAFGSTCYEADHVELKPGDVTVATVYYRILERTGGASVWCHEQTSLPPVSIELSEPLVAGTVVVDGQCSTTRQQVGGEPSEPVRSGVGGC